MLPQKHKGAKKLKYKSGFFITTNKKPKFGKKKRRNDSEEQSTSESDSKSDSDSDGSSEDDNNNSGDKDNNTGDKDNDAVYNRLKCFRTRPLPKKDSSVGGKWIQLYRIQTSISVHETFRRFFFFAQIR